MKKQLIATLVGGLILFIWQFLSWSLLNIHGAESEYVATQDAVLSALNDHLDEDGTYFIPRLAPGASVEEVQAHSESISGQPWAVVHYRTSYSNKMGSNLIRGFISDVVAAFLIVWILVRMKSVNVRIGLLSSLAVGFTGFLMYQYLGAIWFETNVVGHLIDTIVQFGLLGVWLGYYLRTKVV